MSSQQISVGEKKNYLYSKTPAKHALLNESKEYQCLQYGQYIIYYQYTIVQTKKILFSAGI